MNDFTIKNPDGTIDWPASHKARIGAGGVGYAYPPVNQPVAVKPEPKARTLGEQIAWNSAVNNAVQMVAGGVLEVISGQDYLEIIEDEAKRIYKLITE